MNIQILKQKLSTINNDIKNTCINFDKHRDKKLYIHDISLLKKTKKNLNLINTTFYQKSKENGIKKN
jgi:hypothetical protein